MKFGTHVYLRTGSSGLWNGPNRDRFIHAKCIGASQDYVKCLILQTDTEGPAPYFEGEIIWCPRSEVYTTHV